MKQLFLADLADMTEEEIKRHLISEYGAPQVALDKLDILIAYESVGRWGCDSSSFFLVQDKATKDLFEVHGSHCS